MRKLPSWMLTLAVLPLLGAARCCGDQESPPPRATPESGWSQGLERIGAADIASYVARLEFDTTVAAGDAQFLLKGTRAHPVVGPYLVMAPEVGATGLSREGLASGRIIARLTFSRGTADTTRAVAYLYVDRQGGQWRTSVVSTSAGVVVQPRPFTLHEHMLADTTRWLPVRARIIQNPLTSDTAVLGETYCDVCTRGYDWCGRDPQMLWAPSLIQYVSRILGVTWPPVVVVGPPRP